MKLRSASRKLASEVDAIPASSTTFLQLEQLPLEIISNIYALLPFPEKVKLITVCKTWKSLTENIFLNVRWISTGISSCSFPSGCVHTGKEVCPAAEDPEVLNIVLDLCPNLQKLDLDGSKMEEACRQDKKLASRLLSKMSRIRCLTWRQLDLSESAVFEGLRHIRCNSITSRCMRSLMSDGIEGISFTNVTFQQWERLPHGLKFLIEEGKDPSIDLSRLLRSPAAQTLERLKINCVFPESLPVEPVFPRLTYLRIRDCHEEFNSKQLSLLKTVIEKSPAKELYLGVPNVSENPLSNLLSFFSAFHRVETIRQALFIEEHQVVQHLVQNSPLVKTAELILTSITEEVLTLLLGWKNVKKLTLASPGTLRRCTSSELVKFVDSIFAQSIEQLHVIDKLTFSKTDQDELVRIMRARDLKVSFRVGKRFIDAKQRPFTKSTGRTIKSPMLLVHRHRFRSYN